jgi:hypothetical protein
MSSDNQVRGLSRLDNEELNRLYERGEEADRSVFSDMRSNLLMIGGRHYNTRTRDAFINQIRADNDLDERQKIRITKNHTAKIFSLYVNNIVTNSPSVIVVPNNEKELQDQKKAQLDGAVWRHGVKKHQVRRKFRRLAGDFCASGECGLRLSYDPTKGKFLGYEQAMTEVDTPFYDQNGELVTEVPLLDLQGQPVPDKDKPVFSGEFVFKRILPMNLIRPENIKEMDDAEWFCEREMVDTSDLKKMYSSDPQKLKAIEATEDETYVVYDGQANNYSASKKETLVLNFFFKPCMKYPEGYFVIKTKAGILEEGPLPFGIFPIVYQSFEESQDSPRGRSKFTDGRPYQIEINRASSSIIRHQLTLGEDKLIGNTQGKIEHSAAVPGVRLIKLNSGGDLKHLPGRTGDQFVPYLNSQIQEYYSVMMLSEDAIDKEEFSGDAFASLFRSMKQKKKFAVYVEKFEEFMTDVCKLYLRMAKHYLDDEEVIGAIGRDDAVNIEEFRNPQDLGYQIQVEPSNSDIETQYGKQLVLNQALQYVGSSLDKQAIGKIVKHMPFANVGDAFEEFTMDEQNADNMILAIERGQQPYISQYDDNVYMMKKLIHRIRKPDYQYLSQEIQATFENYYEFFSDQEVQKQLELQRAQAGFIPTGGYTVKADFYVDEGGKNTRAEIPYESLKWLMDKLEQQGLSQAALGQLSEQAQRDIAEKINSNAGRLPQLPNGASR